jgi:hypothetical protein
VPQGIHLGPLFFIADINAVLDIFENVRVLAYVCWIVLIVSMRIINIVNNIL